MPGGVSWPRLHGGFERSLRLCGVAAIEPPQALFPSRRRVTGRELNDAIQVGYRGIDFPAPRLEQRKLVAPTRFLIVERDGDFVIGGGLDEQAFGLEAHGQPSPARSVGSIGVDRRRQFIKERRNRWVEVAESARVGWRRPAVATRREKSADDQPAQDRGPRRAECARWGGDGREGHQGCSRSIGITAVASISTSARRSIRPRTTTTDMAGKCRPIISR